MSKPPLSPYAQTQAVRTYRPVKVDHAAMVKAAADSTLTDALKRSNDKRIAFLQERVAKNFLFTPPSMRAGDTGQLWYGDIRITDTRAISTYAGTFTIHASPDLKRDECFVFQQPAPIDPLDAKYDGISLRDLLERDRQRRTEDPSSAWRPHVRPTPTQCAAVSAHWSQELRAKIAAAKQKDRNQVTMDDDE